MTATEWKLSAGTKMSLEEDIQHLISMHGVDEIRSALQRQSNTGDILSIIADSGMHRQPSHLILGERFDFSSGMIDTSSDETVQEHILKCCSQLAQKLREKNWSEVRLFFSGHALLGAYAKLTVYRVTHLDTTDFGFFSDSGFRRVDVELRRHLLVGDQSSQN